MSIIAVRDICGSILALACSAAWGDVIRAICVKMHSRRKDLSGNPASASERASPVCINRLSMLE